MSQGDTRKIARRGTIDAQACATRREAMRRERAVHGYDLGYEIYRAANLRAWATFLDLGCDEGEFLLELRRRWHHEGLLVGVDGNAASLAEATRDAGRLGEELATVRARPDALPFEDECFDAVLLRHPLGEDLAYEAVLAEARRVVRPSGRFVFVAESRVNMHRSVEFLRRLDLELPELHARPRLRGLDAEEATDFLCPVFGPLECHVLNEALYFRHIEQYIAYFATFRDRFDPFPEDSLWEEAMERVSRWASTWFDTRNALAEPESVSIFVATVV